MNVKPHLLAALLGLALLGPAAPAPAAAPISSAPVVVFADAPWHKQAYDYLSHWLGSRARMIQFAVIGMIIALFIICRNRW